SGERRSPTAEFVEGHPRADPLPASGERQRRGRAMTRSLTFRAALLSILIFAAFILAWHLAIRGTGTVQQMDPEYAKLMGATATEGKSAMPGPLDVGAKLWEHIKRPFYDNGPNDKASAFSSPIRSHASARATCWRSWWRCRSAS